MVPPSTDKPKLTPKQTEAVAYLEKECDKYIDIAQRLKNIGMPFPAHECARFAGALRNALDLQIRVIKNPDQFLWDKDKNT